jgi:hypothetical protein
MSSPSTRPSGSQLLEEISDLLVGLGMITMILFPFALPFIALTLVVLAVVAVPAAVGGVLVAAVVGPVLLVKRLRASRRDQLATPPRPPRAEASARGATSLRSPARQSNPAETALGHG